MIDTLFYFVDTEQEYRRQMQGENGLPGISPTTIVFVGDSREIYVNGKGYGKTSTNGLLASSEFDQWKGQLNERIDNVISNAASENEEARQKAEEDLEAAMTLVQSMMDTSAEEMAATIQSVRNQIQQAKTELQENIDSANENADEILSALTTFQGTIRNELETSIRDAITNANGRTIWSELNTTNEGITAMTNRIDLSLNPDGSIKNTQVLQSIIDSGVRNNSAITDIQNKWAVMDDNQQVIEWVASGFKSQAGNEGGLAAVFATAQNNTQNAISAMKTEIEQDVAGNYVASADLGTSVIGIVEDELQVESLSALAMKSDVNSATTTITNRLNTIDTTTGNLLTSLSLVSSVAEEGKARASLLTSVGENGTYLVNESSLDGAMSSILTKSGSGSATLIHQMAQEDIAAADISSQIDEATSVLATKVEVNKVVNDLTGEIETRRTAIAGLQAQITGEDGLTSTLAGVEARVTDNEASLTSLAQWKDDTLAWKAGVVQTANLDGAVAGLIADGTKESGKKVKASVIATVNDDTSAIKLNADHVFVDANKTTTIGSHYDNAYNPAKNGVNTSIATLKTNTDNDRATLTAISTWKDNKGYVADAGLVTDANKDGAMAALFAENSNSNTKAAVAAIVDDGLSTVTLTADRVFIEGQLNVNIKSYYDRELEDIGRDIDALEGTVSGHTTSIAQLNTNATADHASLTALTSWKNNEEYKSGLVSEAGLGGSMASLIAENTAVKAAITARVKDDASQISLTADQIYLDSSKQAKIASQYDPTKNGVNTAINNLNNTVGSHTTSIASLTTNAEADHATLSAIAEWKDTDAYKAGLQTTAGLDGAVANLFAENANTSAKAGVSAIVNGATSTLTLSADKVYIEGNQNVNIKSYFDTELGDAIDGVEDDIEALGNTVAGHTTSIANISTKANNNASSILALSTWKNDFVGSYKSGLVTEAGLSGAMASLIAENDDVKASITTRVKDDASEIELNANQIKLSGSTLANRIEATEGTIGGVTIANNDIHSANNKFKVTSDGKLTATDATITGAITATSLSLSGTKIQTSQINGLSAIATSGDYNDLSNKPVIPTLPENVITADQVSVSETTSANGLTTRTITVGNNTYTSIVGGDFVKTNIGLGNANSGSFVQISNTGLLEAHNAVIYGTIYANGGQIAGFSIQDASDTVPAANIHYSVTSMSDTSHDGVYVGTNGIRLGKGVFSVSDKGALTATDATITGTINATSLNLVGSTKIQPSQISGLSAVATSGSYASLSGTPTIPTKLSQLTNDKNFIDNTALSGYALAANVPTSISQLTGSANILYLGDISTKEETVNGVKVKTITVGDTSYTTISDNNGFIYTNVGYGAQNSDHTSSYFQVSTEGLLTANNAVIYGTVYATNGSFSGTVESANGHIGGFTIGSSNIRNGMTSLSDTTNNGVYLGTDGIALGKGAFKVTNAGAITATSGSIGGFTLGASSISNGLTAMNDSQHNGVYIGTDGIKLGSNDLFSVTKQGILTAKNATITGTINATTLNLGSTVTMPKGDGTTESVSVDDLRNDKLPTVAQTGKFADLADYATAVPSIAKTGKYSDLKDYATAVPSIAKTGKLAEASDYSSLPAIAKIGHGKFSDLDGYSNFPAYLKNLRLPTKSEIGVTKLSDLTDDINVVKSSEVTVTTTTNNDGLTENTISIDGKTFKSIVGEGFVRTNIGLGDVNDKYVEISSDGLLTAKNAVIYGTIYATAGQIGGINISDNGIASSNGNFSLTSAGQLTATGAAISGTITATDGTIGGYTIDSDKLYVSADKSDFANLLGFDRASLTIEKNTSYEKLTGDPYATHSSQFDQFLVSPQAYFPSIQAVLKSNYSLTDSATITNVTDKHIVQLSPIGFRTAYDCVETTSLKKDPGSSTTTKEFTETNRIDATGSGMLGNGGIEWDNNGLFTVSDGFAKSVFDSMQGGFSKTTSTGSGSSKVTTKNTVTPTYESIKLQKEVTTASNGTTTTNAMEITPDAVKVTKNGTTSTGITLSFRIKATGTYQGAATNYDLTLTFTNGILTGYSTNGFPGSTI